MPFHKSADLLEKLKTANRVTLAFLNVFVGLLLTLSVGTERSPEIASCLFMTFRRYVEAILLDCKSLSFPFRFGFIF